MLLLYYIFPDYGKARTLKKLCRHTSQKDTCLLVQISMGFIEIHVLFVCNLHKRCVSFYLEGWKSYPGYIFM